MEEPNDDDVFEQIKKQLDDGVYEQIKDFDREYLTKEQESLVDKLILDEELRNNYKEYGLCKNVGSLKILLIGVEYVFFNKIFKVGLVEITLLISLSKKYN